MVQNQELKKISLKSGFCIDKSIQKVTQTFELGTLNSKKSTKASEMAEYLRSYGSAPIHDVFDNDYNSLKMNLNEIWKYVENDKDLRKQASHDMTELEHKFHKISIQSRSNKRKSIEGEGKNRIEGTRTVSFVGSDLNENQYKISKRLGI